MSMSDFGVYILTMANGDRERWNVDPFNEWVFAQGEHIGHNFATRLEQFKRYTQMHVVDWDYQDN